MTMDKIALGMYLIVFIGPPPLHAGVRVVVPTSQSTCHMPSTRADQKQQKNRRLPTGSAGTPGGADQNCTLADRRSLDKRKGLVPDDSGAVILEPHANTQPMNAETTPHDPPSNPIGGK